MRSDKLVFIFMSERKCTKIAKKFLKIKNKEGGLVPIL